MEAKPWTKHCPPNGQPKPRCSAANTSASSATSATAPAWPRPCGSSRRTAGSWWGPTPPQARSSASAVIRRCGWRCARGTGWPSRQSCDAKGLALVFCGESLPGGLLRYADRRSDPGPADAPVAQAADMAVQRGVGLGGHGLNPRQAGEQLVVGLLGRRAELRHRLAPHVRQFLREDPIAEIDAFVADVDTRTGDELGHRVLVLPAERAAQVLRPVGVTRGLPGNRHNVKVALTKPLRQGSLDEMRPAATTGNGPAVA